MSGVVSTAEKLSERFERERAAQERSSAPRLRGGRPHT